MKKLLLLGALLCATPLSFLLPGCGGGGSSDSSAPTTSTAPKTSNFLLASGQRATLNAVVRGNTLSGTLKIAAAPRREANRSAAAGIPINLVAGTFRISGTFTAPRGFSISVFDANNGLIFTLSGQFATFTQEGSFVLTVNGQTQSGVLPVIGRPFPTSRPTAIPTTTGTTPPVTPPASGISRLESISFTKGAAFNGFGINTAFPLTGQTPTFSNATAFSASNIRLGGDNNLLFEGPFLNRPARVGDVFALGNQNAATGILFYSEAANGGNKNWESTSGTLRVTAVSAKVVNFSLEQVQFAPQSFGNTLAAGNFTLSGRGVFNGS